MKEHVLIKKKKLINTYESKKQFQINYGKHSKNCFKIILYDLKTVYLHLYKYQDRNITWEILALC